MLDVQTDPTLLSATFGSHVEVLEFDDLRHRVEMVTEAETRERVELARRIFTVDDSVVDEDFAWGRPCRWLSTGWWRTSASTPSRTTTGASTASCTSGSAPG